MRILKPHEYFKGQTDYTTDETKLPEKKVESKACDVAKANGWFRRKISSPSDKGIMDRVFVKDGRTVWIEYKRVGKEPTGLQCDVALQLLDHGAEVWWTNTVRGTKEILGIFT